MSKPRGVQGVADFIKFLKESDGNPMYESQLIKEINKRLSEITDPALKSILSRYANPTGGNDESKAHIIGYWDKFHYLKSFANPNLAYRARAIPGVLHQLREFLAGNGAAELLSEGNINRLWRIVSKYSDQVPAYTFHPNQLISDLKAVFEIIGSSGITPTPMQNPYEANTARSAPLDPYAPQQRSVPVDPYAPQQRSVPVDPYAPQQRSVPVDPYAPQQRSVPVDPYAPQQRSVPIDPYAPQQRSVPIDPYAPQQRSVPVDPYAPPRSTTPPQPAVSTPEAPRFATPSETKPKTPLEVMREKITTYNKKNPSQQLKFIHGTSSAIFAFMGRKVLVTSKERTLVEKTIPKALIPTGRLRKEYGVYPVSGELNIGTFGLSGQRKSGVNHGSISGMQADSRGIEVCAGYASGFSQKNIDIEKMHKNVTDLILNMGEKSYIRNLKMLVMHATNLMLMDPQAGEKAEKYLRLLDNEYDALKKLHIKLGEPTDEFDRRFKKYFDQIASILRGEQLAFKSDEEFKASIIGQFPMLVVANTESREFKQGIPGERLIDGEFNFSSIGMILTSPENVEKLKEMLEKQGITHIQVEGCEFPKKKVETQSEPEEFKEFRAALESFLKNGDEDKYRQARDILIQSSAGHAEAAKFIFELQKSYSDLKAKAAANVSYLKAREDGSEFLYSRLDRLEYLKDLADLRTPESVSFFSTDERPFVDTNFFTYEQVGNTDYLSEVIDKFKNDSDANNDKLIAHLMKLIHVMREDLQTTNDPQKKSDIQFAITFFKSALLMTFENYSKSAGDGGSTITAAVALVNDIMQQFPGEKVATNIRGLMEAWILKADKSDEMKKEFLSELHQPHEVKPSVEHVIDSSDKFSLFPSTPKSTTATTLSSTAALARTLHGDQGAIKSLNGVKVVEDRKEDSKSKTIITIPISETEIKIDKEEPISDPGSSPTRRI